jgi:hypothetical protein
MPVLVINHKGKSHKCLYSKQDQELISGFSWSLHSQGYAQTTLNRKTVLMHDLIMKPPEGKEVDHRFHNRLDNRRSKIRVCTRSENRQNSRKLKAGSSVFKGVYKDGKYFHSQIKKNQKVVNLGRYHSEITAAKVYDQVARETFKDFAFLNFPEIKSVQQSVIPEFKG